MSCYFSGMLPTCFLGSDGAGVFFFTLFNEMYTLKTCVYIIWGGFANAETSGV